MSVRSAASRELTLIRVMPAGVPGFFNLLDGIAAVAKSSVFIADARYVFGDLRAWGWVMPILGVYGAREKAYA